MGYSPPTLYIRSYPVQNRGYTNFRKYVKGEVQLPRIPLPRTPVNKGSQASVSPCQ
jgi:hypothetical protein